MKIFFFFSISKGRIKQLANIVLLMIMLGAVYTHYALHDKFDRMAPGIVFSLLLITRLIIYRQEKYSSLNITNEKPTELNEEIENEEDEEDQIDDNQKILTEKKKD